MNQPVIQLYPLSGEERPLSNLYLSQNLRQHAADRAFVYANFVVSIDGRIAVPHPTKPGLTVPQQIANERDWRLFQELAAQSDVIISSGRYLRDWAEGSAQEILQIDEPRFADLRQWRQKQGLPAQPDIAIISRSLDFPMPDILTAGGRKIIVFTTANPDVERVREIEAQAGQVIAAGSDNVAGGPMVAHLVEQGYRTIYSSAGPKILHLLLTGEVLDRLYLTYANRILGGKPYSSIVEGELLETAVGLNLYSLYYDPYALKGAGQLFAAYDLA